MEQITEQLLEMKHDGAPIMNSAQVLKLFVPGFREEQALPEAMPCRVGLRDYFIRTNGDVEVCFYYPAIGNVKEQSAKEIWYSEKAEKIRKETVECEKLCLHTCLSQKKSAG